MILGLASVAPRSPYRRLELCGIAKSKTKGLVACNAQTASPFGCLNNFYFKIGYGEIENILKTAGFILFLLKKIALSPAKFQKSAEKVGIRVGKPPKNGWTTL